MDQRAEIEWREGAVPVSTRFDDPYYSLDDGVAETQHTFLGGNDLPDRYRDGFHIAELGFGTGLNFLVALQAWRTTGTTGHLYFTSFEAFPVAADERAKALTVFDLPADVLEGFVDGQRQGPDFTLTVIPGDARQTLLTWDGMADAWFLDGFSPAKNPELWDPALMQDVGQHTAAGGTCATYTAAGHVRRSLEDAGFAITRVPGFGRKRHMTRGMKV